VRRALPLALSLLTLLTMPATAAARPFSREPDDKPWVRGTLMPSFGLGGSFGSRGGGSLLVAAGLSYFVVNNLGFGLSLRNFTTFLPSSLKADFPGIEKQIPTNEFSVIPGVTLMLYRSYRFTPYIGAGVGPVFLNHKRGVVGEWNAGPGVLIGLGRMFAFSLGVNFSMRFPGDRCDAAYRYQGTDATVSFNSCGVRWGHQRRPRVRLRRRPQAQPSAPAARADLRPRARAQPRLRRALALPRRQSAAAQRATSAPRAHRGADRCPARSPARRRRADARRAAGPGRTPTRREPPGRAPARLIARHGLSQRTSEGRSRARHDLSQRTPNGRPRARRDLSQRPSSPPPHPTVPARTDLS
jgi:hypothetical protein